MKRLPAVLLALALLAFAGAYFGSPVLTLYQLKQAAEAHDTDRLEAMVDFPAVRESLERRVESEVTGAARNGGWPSLDVIGRLGALWGDRDIRKMVEPGGLEQMLANGEVRPALSYLTLDRVRVTLKRPGEADLPLALIMDRRGLFGWRVVEIEAPIGD
jgi:hypothetical protein